MTSFEHAVVLAGKKGLESVVNWVHPLEIWDNPDRWIDGGELIFCSGLGVSQSEELVPFFHKLLEKGIAGFCLQLNDDVDYVPSDMLELADRYSCPLIVFEEPVRYIDLSRGLVQAMMSNVNQDYLREKEKIEGNRWMVDWIHGQMDTAEVTRNLKMIPYELKKYSFFVVLTECRKKTESSRVSESNWLAIAKYLRNHFENHEFSFYPFFMEGKPIGVILDYGKNSTWKARFHSVEKNIHKETGQIEGFPSLLLVAGHRSRRPDAVQESYRTAKETMEICKRFSVDKFIFEDLNLYYILSLLDNGGSMDRLRDFVKKQFMPFYDYGGPQSDKLLNTLKVYYDCSGNKQLAAEELGVSRRTLYNHLEQIEMIMEIDPMDAEKRLTMELAFAFRKLLEE